MFDNHPRGANERGRTTMPKPFQISVATLLPRALVNSLFAVENIGVTHLTNGAIRLHPMCRSINQYDLCFSRPICLNSTTVGRLAVSEGATVLVDLTVQSRPRPNILGSRERRVLECRGGVHVGWGRA